MKLVFSTIVVLSVLSVQIAAQTTGFNFQGRLNDGSSPANGRYDLQFLLYDAIVGGSQVGPIVQKPNQLLANGVFSTSLDFGAAAFSGGDRFLEIQLRPTGSPNVTPNAFVILGVRQQLLSVPFAVKSLSAANATSAVNATNATNAQTAVNSQQLGGVAANQYVQQNSPGMAKFTAVVTSDILSNFSVTTCYNATLTGPAMTTPPCGLTIDHFTSGGFGLTFNFDISNRPIVATAGTYSAYNVGVYLRTPANQTLYNVDLRSYRGGADSQTTDIQGFTIVVF